MDLSIISILRGLLGIAFILFIAFIFSEQRKNIQWKVIFYWNWNSGFIGIFNH